MKFLKKWDNSKMSYNNYVLYNKKSEREKLVDETYKKFVGFLK